MIPLSEPTITGNEWAYIRECLDTNWVSSVGSFINRFEAMVADRVGARYGVAVVNGTAALHVALLVAGIEADDEVLVPALTFIAPANAVRYVGAWPVFIDAESTYWQMDVGKVSDFLECQCQSVNGVMRNRVTGRRVRAILPVDLLGHPFDANPLRELASRYGLVIVEDATESLGATYRGRPVGGLGDIACFSFNGNKILTTGGGGVIVTNDETWATRARYLTTQAKDDPLEYVHGAIGYNYRLTNILAAMGCAQMEQLDKFVTAKRQIAARYTAQLQDVPGIQTMPTAPWAESTHWLYTVLIDASVYGIGSRELLRTLAGAGVQTRPLWQPLHLSPAHPEGKEAQCPVAEGLHRCALSIPCSVSLSAPDQQRVIDLLRTSAAAHR